MRKEEIKQAALTLFANNGFEGTSLADIAGVVGLKKQSIYSHFKDKDDLFLSIMKDAKSTEIDYYRAKLRDSDLSRPDLVLSSLLFGVKELYDTDEAYQFWLRYGFNRQSICMKWSKQILPRTCCKWNMNLLIYLAIGWNKS